MRLLARIVLLALLPALLAGCIEISARTDLLPDGTARTHTDIAISKIAVEQLVQMQAETTGKSKKAKTAKPATFASVCESGLNDLLSETKAPAKSKKAAPSPAAALPKPRAPHPSGMSTMSVP